MTEHKHIPTKKTIENSETNSSKKKNRHKDTIRKNYS